ncbi:MBL fold metallo-hydrolase [Alicyclobacillaceae bacterium I2511]|nr:MBL fold metallo-hydrolase [Alicyclobacillaceae bacterium I2511]
MSELKVTVLVENTVGISIGLLSEWGLSMLLDFGDERILFDTGEQGSLLANAQAMGIDLKQIHRVVLSHGHYDHTGGLLKFLQLRGHVPVYAHAELFAGHYGRGGKGQGNKYLGVPFRQEQLESAGAEFHWCREPLELRTGLWISGEIPRKTAFERVDERLIQLREGQAVQDSVPDDFSLFFVSQQGLIILFGCAHAGLVNIVEHAKQVTGEHRVRALIGGTHLGPASKDQQEKTVAYLKSLDLACLAPNHCTGPAMSSRLASEFPHQFVWANAGNTLEF